MFCPNCGKEIPEGYSFCGNCGSRIANQTAEAPASASPAPGYSKLARDKRITAGLKKNRKAAAGCGMVLIPIPLIGFVLYSLISGKMEFKTALIYGGAISAVFLIVNLISSAAAKAEKEYEGTVTDKQTREVTRHRGDNSIRVTEYVTYVKTSDGKTKKIVEREGSMIIAYSYLKVGDRFLYHPGFAFPYELYDKSRAPYLGCAVCGTHNPVESDTCKKCGAPLIK